MIRQCFNRGASFILAPVKRMVGGARRLAAFVLAAVVVALGASSAHATEPNYIVDIGVDPADLVTALATVLGAFLIAAIGLGFGFFAVRKGVKWLKGMAGG